MTAFDIDPSLQDEPLDEAALTRLVALAGPADGPELLRRLIADLAAVLGGLTTGFAAQDRDAIRRQSHVLLAIAGTIGAPHVYDLAQLLNQTARDASHGAAPPEAIDLLQRLSGLIDRLQRLSGQIGMG